MIDFGKQEQHEHTQNNSPIQVHVLRQGSSYAPAHGEGSPCILNNAKCSNDWCSGYTKCSIAVSVFSWSVNKPQNGVRQGGAERRPFSWIRARTRGGAEPRAEPVVLPETIHLFPWPLDWRQRTPHQTAGRDGLFQGGLFQRGCADGALLKLCWCISQMLNDCCDNACWPSICDT